MKIDKNQKTIICPAGVNLLDFLNSKQIDIPAFCDGNGICGRCRIHIIEGNVPITPSDRSFLSEKLLHNGWRLACRAISSEPVKIMIASEFKNSRHVPEHIRTAMQSETKQHHYGITVSGASSALIDLTSVTIVDIVNETENPIELVKRLFTKYPDAENGLKKIILIRNDKPNFTFTECEIIHLSPDKQDDDSTSLEKAILYLFDSGKI